MGSTHSLAFHHAAGPPFHASQAQVQPLILMSFAAARRRDSETPAVAGCSSSDLNRMQPSKASRCKHLRRNPLNSQPEPLFWGVFNSGRRCFMRADMGESGRGLHLRVSGEAHSSRLVRTLWLVAVIHMLIPFHSLHFTAFIFPN